MVHAEIPRRCPWVGMIWFVAILLGALLALINIYAGVLLIAFSTALALGFATLQRSPAYRAPAARSREPRRIAWPPMAQRTVATPEGFEQAALVIPIERNDGYEMVLTADGYKLVDAAGRVVYALKRP